MSKRKKTKTYHRYWYYRRRVQLLIISGVIVIVFLLGSYLFGFGLKTINKIPNPHIITPYYDKTAFVKPAHLPTPLPVDKNIIVKVPIIMYHYVEYIKDYKDVARRKLNIGPDIFESQLKTLKNYRYDTFFVKDIPEIINGKIDYSTHSAALTFDDGYEDFYTVVFPLLKKYHVRATVYVIYNFIGRKGYLDKDQIRALIESDLVEIGSHTLDHIALKSVSLPSARRQIFESKRLHEETFNIPILSFAYPFGSFNDSVRRLVEDASYTTAVSVIPGSYQSIDNLFYLFRLRPGLLIDTNLIKLIESMKQ